MSSALSLHPLEGVLDIMRGRLGGGEVYSRRSIDPRIPTNTGTEHVGFLFTDQADITRTKREAKREVLDESHEG